MTTDAIRAEGDVTPTSPEIKATKKRPAFIVLGFTLVIVFALLGLFVLAGMQRQAPPLDSGLAPQFELTTFDGQKMSLADLRGKAVVVNFWASWCIPCRDEAPALEAVWQKYKDQGVVVLGIDYVDTESEAKQFIEKYGQTYPNGPDLGTAISERYKITGVPETYFITREGQVMSGTDPNGRPYGNWIGPIPAAALEGRVLKLLEE